MGQATLALAWRKVGTCLGNMCREHLGLQLVCGDEERGVVKCLFFYDEATIMKPKWVCYCQRKGTPSMNGIVLDADFIMQTNKGEHPLEIHSRFLSGHGGE